MWRSKKFILITLLAVVVLGVTMGGVALAQTGNEDGSQPGDRYGALLDRVCEIYEENTGAAIDSQQLKDSFTQAQSEMRDEALDNRLQRRVEQGDITQGEADQYKGWWQSRPEDPSGFGFKGHGGFRGMGGMRGFGGPCAFAK